jgi:hypothetical protein
MIKNVGAMLLSSFLLFIPCSLQLIMVEVIMGMTGAKNVPPEWLNGSPS